MHRSQRAFQQPTNRNVEIAGDGRTKYERLHLTKEHPLASSGARSRHRPRDLSGRADRRGAMGPAEHGHRRSRPSSRGTAAQGRDRTDRQAGRGMPRASGVKPTSGKFVALLETIWRRGRFGLRPGPPVEPAYLRRTGRRGRDDDDYRSADRSGRRPARHGPRHPVRLDRWLVRRELP
jgi:hypothetical protein